MDTSAHCWCVPLIAQKDMERKKWSKNPTRIVLFCPFLFDMQSVQALRIVVLPSLYSQFFFAWSLPWARTARAIDECTTKVKWAALVSLLMFLTWGGTLENPTELRGLNDDEKKIDPDYNNIPSLHWAFFPIPPLFCTTSSFSNVLKQGEGQN